eukprot:403340033
MLKQWSKEVLRQWIQVYALVLPKITQIQQDSAYQDKQEKDCIDIIIKMTDMQSPIQVRMSSPYFLGYIAKHNSLRSKDTYVSKCLPRIKAMCQDFNWEVRKEMCANLAKICTYLGMQITQNVVYQELVELVDDEEQEVKIVAFKTYAKFLKKIFPSQFKNDDQNIRIVKKILSETLNEMSGDDIRKGVYKNLNDIISAIQNNQDDELIALYYENLKYNLTIDTGKLILAQSIKSISEVYENSPILIKNFYLPLYQSFIKEVLSCEDIQLKEQLAKNFHVLIQSVLLMPENQIENVMQIKSEILEIYGTLLKSKEKEVLNAVVINAQEVFRLFQNNQKNLDKTLLKIFNDKIRKPLLSSNFQKKLSDNWRYLINYYDFLQKLFEFIDRDEANLEIFPICLKGLKQDYTPTPVKQFIVQSMANVIGKLPNNFLRISIQETMIKDFATSDSYQNHPELIENEQRINQQEREEKDSVKKKEMEGMIRQMRDDYMRKMGSISSSGGSFLGVSSFSGALKDNRVNSSSKIERKSNASSTASSSIGLNLKLQKNNKSENKPKEEQKIQSSLTVSSSLTSSGATKKASTPSGTSSKPGSSLKKR